MISPGYTPIPDWFSWENDGGDVAVADVTGSGTLDLVVFMIDAPPGQNQGKYRLGRDLDAGGNVTGGWTPWIDVPDWFSWENQGGGVAVADVTGNGTLDLVVFMIDSAPQQNQGVYRLGRDLDGGGNVTGGWTPWIDVPDWFSWENQGGGVAVADVTGNGTLDLVVFMIDSAPQQNQAKFRVGRNLDAAGNVTGGWSLWQDVPDWFTWDNAGGGVAVADVSGNGTGDVVVFGIDNSATQNQAFYRIGLDLDGNGQIIGDWSSLLGVNNWFSWDNQYGGIAVARLGGGAPMLFVMGIDHDAAGNLGFYTVVALAEDPPTHGRWELLPYFSEVLPIHAALLHSGNVLFAAGSGNNPVRVAAADFGDVAHHMYTSVVWDPNAPDGGFQHPATLRRANGHPFDFFCGGHSFLADGSLLFAGGNLGYNYGDNLGLRESATFDPIAATWTMRTPMEHGRWYPTLLTLADGGVLAVSGKNDTDGGLNLQLETYDPQTHAWTPHPPPNDPQFTGLPYYAHLFLLADGRLFFSGGRMDDGDSAQQAGIIDLAHGTFLPVAAHQDSRVRNQSSSVLLAPAQSQQVMLIGGGPADDNTSATGITEIVDFTAFTPTYDLAMPLSLPRIHLNAVLLPDRTVFVSGGAIAHEVQQVPPIARLQSEIYDPETGAWRPGAAASVIRMYHSVALLLPDGRVATACGNPPPYGHQAPWLPPQPNEEMRLELYSPPYLFAGPRPTIGAVPAEWQRGTAVAVPCDDPAHVRWAQLIRPGVTTHAFDCAQRLVDLPITASDATTVTVGVPGAATLLPPGWYMLTIVNQARVPSTATWVHLPS